MTAAAVNRERLRRAMLDNGKSAHQVARATGLSPRAVRGAVAGTSSPRASTIEAIARCLHVQPSSLWDIEPGTRKAVES